MSISSTRSRPISANSIWSASPTCRATSDSTHDTSPIPRKAYSLPYRDVATAVIFTPATIEFQNQDYPIIDKWDDVAQIINDQYTGFNKVSKQAHDKAREIAGSLPDGRPRAEAIYKYLQQNITSSHLLGVNLYGSADELITNKRADPDALNALFVSMLKEVKVDADLVLVTASNWDQLIADFSPTSPSFRVPSCASI